MRDLIFTFFKQYLDGQITLSKLVDELAAYDLEISRVSLSNDEDRKLVFTFKDVVSDDSFDWKL